MNNIRGCGTALVTPFKSNLDVDYDVFRKLVARQIQSGVHFLVPLGTTGETPCLEEDEKLKLLEISVFEANGKIPVVAGAGSNNTKHAINNVKLFEKTGVDAFLIVTPYYNKPTQDGIYRHFKMIAESTDKPIIMYNVPGRTSSNMTAETCLRLAEIKNIIAVKEASSNHAQISEIIRNAPSTFDVLSGNDDETLALVAVGAKGVISVASNIAPLEVSELVNLILAGNFSDGRVLHNRLLPLFNNCFIESNPIPVKAGMYKMGLLENVLRPPLFPCVNNTLLVMENTIKELW